MPAPLLFIGLPILIAPLVYGLYRARAVAVGLALATVVVLVVLLVVEPLDVEPELQLIEPLSTWVQVWVNVDGLLSVLVSVLVWVAKLS